MIHKPLPINRDYNRDPDIEALKRRRCINHGFTVGWYMGAVLEVLLTEGPLGKHFLKGRS